MRYCAMRIPPVKGTVLPSCANSFSDSHNLYPSRPENPFVLLHIADSYKEAGRWNEASLFYAALLSQHPGCARYAHGQTPLCRRAGAPRS